MLIYSNAINMAVERLGDTLATRIGSAMSTVAASMKEMTADFEKQQRCLQVHFDLAVRKMITQKTIPGSPQPPPLGTPLMDNMYSTYMDE